MVSLADRALTHAHPTDELRGRPVIDLCHHRLGEVGGVVIDEEERKPRLLVVASGGILGLAHTKFLVPVDAVSRVGDVVHIEASHEQVRGAAYASNLEPSQAYDEVCRHYGYLPFWATGYIEPPFLRG
jgi:sporulation protein YlmC with PRC-barrel domain